MGLQAMFIIILLLGSTGGKVLLLKVIHLGKLSERKTSDMQVKRVDSLDSRVYHYPAEDTTHGIGYGHHLHPFYYQGKATSYDCALQGEWHPIVSGPELDFGINGANIIGNVPFMTTQYNKYSTVFPAHWKDSETFIDNTRSFSTNSHYLPETQPKIIPEDHQHGITNNTNWMPVLQNKKVPTYLTPPPISKNAYWRNILNLPHEKHSQNPGKVMDLITTLHNFKLLPLLNEDDEVL